MKYSLNILGIILVTVSTIAFPIDEARKAISIGCDTYYRVTGEIAGCSDSSTENAREVWIERYNICLQQQLSREISIYKNKLEIYYVQWSKQDSEQNETVDNIFFQKINTSSLSLAENQYKTYRGNADFCK